MTDSATSTTSAGDSKQQNRQAIELLHAMSESTHDLIAAVDMDLRYTFVNAALRREFKKVYDLDIEVGIRVEEAFARHPGERDAAVARWRHVLGGEDLRITRDVSTHPDDPRCFDLRYFPLRDSEGRIVGAGQVTTDVSERRRTDRALAESEARFRAVFEQAIVGLVTTDVHGRVLRANDAFLRIVGRPASELIGRDSATYTHPDDRAINVANITQLRDDNSNSIAYEKRYIRPDGTLVFAQVNLSPMRDSSGGIVSLIAIVEDVTERRRADRLTQESEARLRFLAELDERTRDLSQPEDVMAASAMLLGQRLKASRCAYAEVEADEERFTIWHDYIDGCASTVGSYNLSLFGPRAAADQRAGRTLLIRDVDRELPADGDGAAMFNAIDIRAIICCPLVRGGRLVAMMAVHQTVPRDWTNAEVRFVEAVVERSWSFLERARTARVLRESEARLGDVVRTALDCIIGMDEHGLVNEWNPAAERTFGISREEAIGREMAELIIPPALRPMHRTGLAHYLQTGEAKIINRRLELHAIRRDGTEFPVELTITRNTLSARPTFTGYVRDITDRRRAEAEREALLLSERSARSEAERASQMKDEFLATLSHELRTPLNAILGWSQIVRRPAASGADMKQGLEVIERNARAQAQIIEDLLDMSRIVSGNVRLDVHAVDLAQLIQSALETARAAADAKGIRLQSFVDPLVGATVSGDANRLQQVLWNLMTNAIKFTPRMGAVDVVLKRIDSHIELSVIDTGEGIRPDFLPFVFDRFRQEDASTTRRHGGLGLGLSIVKQLVELHGGTVSARSAGAGLGTTVTVTLPLATADRLESALEHSNAIQADSPPESEVAAIASTVPALHGVRVLVVDDEADARNLLRRLLEDARATVTVAASAAEALDLLQAQPSDVLVSDIGMPGEDGYVLIRRVRTLSDSVSKVPAIALTAFARTEDRVRAMVAGYQMHIAKPVEPAELLAMIASLATRAEDR